MGILNSILHFLIPPERTLLHTAFEQKQYFEMKSRLSAAGIRHRSRIIGGMQEVANRARTGGNTPSRYELYVRKEDEYKALQAIRR
ncbi:hypothetical protein D3C73_793120 [compost metagenome]